MNIPPVHTIDIDEAARQARLLVDEQHPLIAVQMRRATVTSPLLEGVIKGRRLDPERACVFDTAFQQYGRPYCWCWNPALIVHVVKNVRTMLFDVLCTDHPNQKESEHALPTAFAAWVRGLPGHIQAVAKQLETPDVDLMEVARPSLHAVLEYNDVLSRTTAAARTGRATAHDDTTARCLAARLHAAPPIGPRLSVFSAALIDNARAHLLGRIDPIERVPADVRAWTGTEHRSPYRAQPPGGASFFHLTAPLRALQESGATHTMLAAAMDISEAARISATADRIRLVAWIAQALGTSSNPTRWANTLHAVKTALDCHEKTPASDLKTDWAVGVLWGLHTTAPPSPTTALCAVSLATSALTHLNAHAPPLAHAALNAIAPILDRLTSAITTSSSRARVQWDRAVLEAQAGGPLPPHRTAAPRRM